MNFKALVAELIGTFALIFIGVGAIAADKISGGQSGLVGIALAHGLTIAVMASATVAISGGHLNPAVTIGLFTARKIDGLNAAGYVIAQCVGAILAAFAIKIILPESLASGTPNLGTGVSVQVALLTEIILTFFLVFVVYGTAVHTNAPKVGALFIGLTVTLDILMGGPITGAAMNPARHLGPALVGGNFENIWLYWLGPVLGGVIAANVYRCVLEQK